jgi:hypothetical protein
MTASGAAGEVASMSRRVRNASSLSARHHGNGCPLGAHFFEAAQQELAETAGVLDLSEHRLGQLPAQPVAARRHSYSVGNAPL